jgi:DNA polymerase III alpha subunit
VVPPDINESGEDFIINGRTVRAPLWIVEGVSYGDATEIRRFTSKHQVGNRRGFDLLIEESGITYKAAEALLRAGALESAGIAADETLEPWAADAPRGEEARDAREGREPPPAPAEGQLTFELEPTPSQAPEAEPTPATPPVQNQGNKGGRYVVLPTLAEFHPHAIATPVELAGRISDLRTFKSSSEETIGFFMLRDSTASVPVFVTWERVGQPGDALGDGDEVLVRGVIRMREGLKTCEAVEVSAGGVTDNGKTTPDESSD